MNPNQKIIELKKIIKTLMDYLKYAHEEQDLKFINLVLPTLELSIKDLLIH